MEDTENIVAEAEREAESAADSHALYEVKMKFLGRTGKVTALLKSMREIAAEHRPAFGKKVNELREALEAKFALREEKLKQREMAQKLAGEKIDVTMPGKRRSSGALHPVTRVKNQLIDVFAGMGFEV